MLIGLNPDKLFESFQGFPGLQGIKGERGVVGSKVRHTLAYCEVCIMAQDANSLNTIAVGVF